MTFQELIDRVQKARPHEYKEAGHLVDIFENVPVVHRKMFYDIICKGFRIRVAFKIMDKELEKYKVCKLKK